MDHISGQRGIFINGRELVRYYYVDMCEAQHLDRVMRGDLAVLKAKTCFLTCREI